MWIHVPETYSPSVADTEELNLDLKWLSELAQSVTWKTKSVQPRSLQHVWKTTPSIRHLSGLTCDPLTQSRGVAKWISSLEDSHVSPIQSLVAKEEKTIQGNSQEKSSELQPDLDTQLSFSRMLKASSDFTGITYDPNYERWAMRLRKDSSQRQKLGHHIRGRDFSSWPTPRVSDTEGGIAPNVEMNNGSFSRKNQEGVRWGVKLKDATANWPTPNASEHKYRLKGDSQQSNGLTATARKSTINSIPQDLMNMKNGHDCSPSCRRLNPLFAEMLMGLPLGWTNDSEPLEMELFQQWQRMLGHILIERMSYES